MADNPPPAIPPTPPPNPGPRPTLPAASGLTGRLKNPTTRLPIRTGGGGKIVVMLSSVAKPPPAGTQALPRVTPVPPMAPAVTPDLQAAAPVLAQPAATSAPAIPVNPPPLPPKQVVPGNNQPAPSRPQLSATTYVKLPPKTGAPGLVSLSGKPATPPLPTPVPVLPAKQPEPVRTELKKPGGQHIPPIRLNEPVSTPGEAAAESIFLQRQSPEPAAPPTVAPESAKSPAPAVVPPPVRIPSPAPTAPPSVPPQAKAPVGDMVSLDLFEKSQTPAPIPTPAPVAPAPEAKERPVTLVPPTLQPPPRLAPPAAGPRPSRPPPLPPTLTKPMAGAISAPPAEKLPPPAAKPVEAPVPSPVNVVPPMLEKAPEPPPAEKLPPPIAAKPVEVPAAPTPFLVAPPMLEKAPEPVSEKLPPPISAKPAESPVSSTPFVTAPPLAEKAPEPSAEKRAQPNLPVTEARKSDAPPAAPAVPAAPPMTKAPAMKVEPPPKPPQPPTKPKRSITSWLKKTAPLVVSSTSPKTPAPVAETKPALKPPVVPARSMLTPTAIVEEPPVAETPKLVEAKAPEKAELPKTDPALPATTPPAKSPALDAAVAVPAIAAAALAGKKIESAAKVEPVAKSEPPVQTKPAGKTAATPPPAAPVATKTKDAPAPLTRAERAKKRRFLGTLFFWLLLFPLTVLVLVWGCLRFGRDTRIEGQVIPPPGTVLSNEVWIVTDFRSLASGITEDLAAERTPVLQDIQERQDHVQRAQADVASREERIRLIQEEIAASKSEIENIVKQARDATQKVWDVDGAQADLEYKSRMEQLQHAIADRAKSLNLKYEPDATYNSPEVWANAYRLALYQVPAGVDSVKEHAWLSDQMKAWRDYQKSMDDRTEQLREKAAQIKLGPAPKIADLNSKIDELNQRIDATEAEEVPLKAELQQAQTELATAQGADASLDDKYYKQLYSLPGEAVTKRIPLAANGRFTWVDDNIFVEGEKEHRYYFFARATRADGRQYWALGRINLGQFEVLPVLMEPPSFVSTKAILRPNLSPEEQEQ